MKTFLIVLMSFFLFPGLSFGAERGQAQRLTPQDMKEVKAILAKAKTKTLKRHISHYRHIGKKLNLTRAEWRRFMKIIQTAKRSNLDNAQREIEQKLFSSVRGSRLNSAVHPEQSRAPQDAKKLRKLLGPKRFAYLRELERGFAPASARRDSADIESLVGIDFLNWFHLGPLHINGDTTLTKIVLGQVIIDADDVILNCGDNLIIDLGNTSNCGTNNDESCGVKVDSRTNVKILNCHVYQFEIGMWVNESDNTDIYRSSATANDVGFQINDSQNSSIRFSDSFENAREGFRVRDSRHSFFQHDAAVRNSRDGFDENDGANPYYLRNNSALNGVNGFELDFASDATYWENFVLGNGQHGISLDAVNSGRIRGNEITANGGDGLRLDDESNIGTVNFEVRLNESNGNGNRSAHQCANLCINNVFINNMFNGPTNNI